MPDCRLRKLELTGFKTFARRTEVILPGGLTGIVGPNGSGKSNLADALRWVLGEQSLHHIRSKKTEDVIFAGGTNRPPMGVAEVTLTLDNTSGWIPIDFSEVSISRRAYRSGDNEYFINGSRVRLRDVIELRNRAGFGQSSYSVIGQGLVDAVLSQRPEERRALFEEAAGVRHYQAKRDQTLEQLAATHQNLLRVHDIVTEIEPRLESLRRQSEKTRQHADLTEELRTLQIRWYASRQRQLQRQAAEAESLLTEAQRQLEQAGEQLRALEAQAASLEGERHSLEQSLAAENQRAAELCRRQEHLLGQVELASDKLQFMQQQGQDVERELAELAEVQTRLSQQRQQLAGDLDALGQAETDLAQQVQEAERAATGRGAEAREIEQGLQETRDRLATLRSSQDQRRREVEELEERRRDLLRQAQQHDEDVGHKQALVTALAEKQASLQHELQQLRSEEEQLSGTTEGIRLEAAATARAEADKQIELEQLRRSHDELSTRQRLLEELQANMEGLAEGARELLRSGRPGVLGSLAEGLKVQPGYERAIAAALGHKLDAVLVQDEPAALDILPHVSEATLALPSSANPHAPPLPAGEGITAATEVVTGSRPAIRLLAGTVIVNDLEQALMQARAGWRAATLAGDVAEPDGIITRRGISVGEAVLKRQRALDDLAAQVAASERSLASESQEHERLVADSTQLAARLAQLEEEVRRRAAVRQQRASQMRDLAQQIQAAQAQIDWLASLKGQAEEQTRTLDLRRAALLAELDQLAEQIPAVEAEAGVRLAQAEALRQADEAQAQQLAELRLQRGVKGQDVEHVRAQIQELEQQLNAAERQLAARQQRATDHAATLHKLEADIEASKTTLEGVRQQLGEREAQLPPLRNRLTAAAEDLRKLRQQESETHEQRSELDKRCYRLEFDSQRKRDELEALALSLLEELQLTPDVLPEPASDAPEPSKREVEALKTRLAALGPVNPGALDEFQEVQERYDFLTSQKADLEHAARQLQTVIAELEELTKRQFMETFERVAHEFQRFFGLMFNGGQVQMFLTDPENVHATGVDILAQPPGKRLQSLPLLSGGERALIASALLFAILSAKPVPFCLLDEVDAALDEANVKRFCQALKSLAEETQFVVITHNRETMAVADALYGVSMTQDGVSRLVSLRLPREEEEAPEIPLLPRRERLGEGTRSIA
ncbi:MAG TPA: chromosome segregation protein SMC [Chloroflexota bacterium]|nr:chromosome segregation protein SMC [Chloroflexota bacterium]